MEYPQLVKIVLVCALSFIGLGFIFGWLFPVEGPYDYLYDEHAKQPAHHRPPVTIIEKKQVTVDINDLSLEDLQALEELFIKSKGEQQ